MSNSNIPVLYNPNLHGRAKKQYYIKMIGQFLYNNPTQDTNNKLTLLFFPVWYVL